MGITRWTQDLTPYLQPASITTTSDDEIGLIVQNLVIDGPSMVYHVYNALAVSSPATPGSFNVPTYLQLNTAINCFLTDLESCGAKIERIFFDGALPVSKRSTRLDRLEKTRIQLERLKALDSLPTSSSWSKDPDKSEVSNVLWQVKPGSSRSSSLTAPFIVPNVIEHLAKSKWSLSLSVVCGEAETYCASAARETGATVLSNDSDFTLLADMQDGGIVGLLHTLNMSVCPPGESLIVRMQCWQPKRVKMRLDTRNLLHAAYERSRDPTASFTTILQRSKSHEREDEEQASEFARFADQFRSTTELKGMSETRLELRLNPLDPRLAELVCQVSEVSANPPALQGQDFWVTLPILLEDPSKDASWTYGRELRQLAYSLLFASHGQSIEDAHSVTESIRKGQRITQEAIEMVSAARLRHTLISCVDDLTSLLGHIEHLNDLSSSKPRNYMLWALRNVLKQRAVAGKSIMPSITIRQYLGLADLYSHSSSANKKTKPIDREAEWRLLHLNANVQSALYSLRMLRQICILLKDIILTMKFKDEFARLLQLIESMPSIQDLFLDVDEVRLLMQQSPPSSADRVSLGLLPDSRRSPQTRSLSKVVVEPSSAPMTEVVRKRKKQRRKHGKGDVNDGSDQPKMRKSVSSNPFELLTDRG